MKYIIPFIDNSNWQTNENCPYCKQIDNLIKKIMSLQTKDENLAFERIEHLETFLADGYEILKTFEANGYIFLKLNTINGLYTLKNVDENVLEKYRCYLQNEEYIDPKGDVPTTLHSRWCKHCGFRKPDIYDTNRIDRMDLLPITNFFINANDNILEIVWRDSKAESFSYSKLIINNKTILTGSYNEYETSPYLFEVDRKELYEIYVVNYDKFGKELTRTDLVYFTLNIEIPNPQPITDFRAMQEVRLVENEYGEYIRRNCIVCSFTPTTESTAIRMALNGFPYTHNYGLECNIIQPIDDSDLSRWYIKPFPMSEQYVHMTKQGFKKDYVYNFDSNGATFQLVSMIADTKNLNIVDDYKKCYITWKDVNDSRWMKSIVVIKEYDGKPIISADEGTVIYENYEYNKHVIDSFTVDNLINGKKYQIGVFPVTQDELILVGKNQGILYPRYLVKSLLWYEGFQLTYMDNFYWDDEDHCISTVKKSVGYLICKYPFYEGGKVKLKIRCNVPISFNIYLNENNVFSKEYNGYEITQWKEISFEIPIMIYCKIVFAVKSKYVRRMKFSMSDINIYYYYDYSVKDYLP